MTKERAAMPAAALACYADMTIRKALSANSATKNLKMTKLTHKEMTAHIRKRIKIAGIVCKTKMAAGGNIIVSVPEYGVEFSEEQQRAIRHIAICNKLTWVRAMPINVDQMTNPYDFSFFMPSE